MGTRLFKNDANANGNDPVLKPNAHISFIAIASLS